MAGINLLGKGCPGTSLQWLLCIQGELKELVGLKGALCFPRGMQNPFEEVSGWLWGLLAWGCSHLVSSALCLHSLVLRAGTGFCQ